MKAFAIVIAILLLLPAVFAIKTVNVLGEDDDKFSTLEDVYIQDECAAAANLTVDVHIVEDQTAWTINNSIVDLANGPVRVQANGTGNISKTLIWAAPLDPGTYDVVVDVDGDKVYDDAMDCVHTKSKVGLTVVAPGSGHVISTDTDDKTWALGSYANTTMLQLNITTSKKEKIDLKAFKLISFGLGDEKLVNKVFIAEDTNANGVFTVKDKILGSSNFSIDDDTVRVALSRQLDAGTSKTLFIVYEMGAVKEGDTFTVKLANITASGNNSEVDIIFSSLPLTSGTTTVVEGGEIEITEEIVSEENATENETSAQTVDTSEVPKKWKKREKDSGAKGILLAMAAVSLLSLFIFFLILIGRK